MVSYKQLNSESWFQFSCAASAVVVDNTSYTPSIRCAIGCTEVNAHALILSNGIACLTCSNNQMIVCRQASSSKMGLGPCHRVQPTICIRCWYGSSHEAQRELKEVLNVALTHVMLKLKCCHGGDKKHFPIAFNGSNRRLHWKWLYPRRNEDDKRN